MPSTLSLLGDCTSHHLSVFDDLRALNTVKLVMETIFLRRGTNNGPFDFPESSRRPSDYLSNRYSLMLYQNKLKSGTGVGGLRVRSKEWGQPQGWLSALGSFRVEGTGRRISDG